MEQYKVGDKVKVKSWKDLLQIGDLKPNTNSIYFKSCNFVEAMKIYCEQEVYITEIKKIDNQNNYTITDSYYNFRDWMFELPPLEQIIENLRKEYNGEDKI